MGKGEVFSDGRKRITVRNDNKNTQNALIYGERAVEPRHRVVVTGKGFRREHAVGLD